MAEHDKIQLTISAFLRGHRQYRFLWYIYVYSISTVISKMIIGNAIFGQVANVVDNLFVCFLYYAC